VREDPIISGAWIKAALVVLVAAALGFGGYLLASGVDINLPDLPDVGTNSTQTTLNDTTLQDTTIGQPEATNPSIQRFQELTRCTQAANGDFKQIQKCFDRFNNSQ
jgi:hypothetical protein